jgi:hypothetical protein
MVRFELLYSDNHRVTSVYTFYNPGESTEAALLKIQNDMLCMERPTVLQVCFLTCYIYVIYVIRLTSHFFSVLDYIKYYAYF